MRALILLTAAAFAIVHMMATATAAPQEERAASPVGAILALDAAIQKRFETVDRRFGFTRLLLPNGAHGFSPENDEEISSLRELEDANLRVALYLASRRFVAPAADQRAGHTADRIRGPLAITRGPSGATPPAASMRSEGRKAFRLFERNDPQYEFPIGQWMVVARPVRAINATCVKCHTSSDDSWPTNNSDLRVGDVLGVVFYAYQPATASL